MLPCGCVAVQSGNGCAAQALPIVNVHSMGPLKINEGPSAVLICAHLYPPLLVCPRPCPLFAQDLHGPQLLPQLSWQSQAGGLSSISAHLQTQWPQHFGPSAFNLSSAMSAPTTPLGLLAARRAQVTC